MASQLLFADEFNSFDAYSKTDAWHTAYPWGPNTVINNEKAYYVDTENAGTTGPAGATNPFSASNGVLTITTAPTSKSLPTGQTYTSGALTTLGTFSHQYGYYEINADLAGGKGYWPAFWLLPANKTNGPELDIMEFSSRLPNEYATTAHSTAGGTYKMSQQFNKNLPDLSSGFHKFGVDWQSDKITWYFDDKAVYSIATPADFHQPMYVLLNQAAGGSGGGWIGDPDGSTQTYKIDYVRVYDTKPTTTTGTGTGTTTPTTPTTPTPTNGDTTIVVNAKGMVAGGVNAHFNMLVDGVKIGEGMTTTTSQDYTFTTKLAANTAHKVQVQFDNDASVNGQDRNLIVDKVTINGHAVSPTDSIVSVDRFALDGVDIEAGPADHTLWNNGTLVVASPASYYPAASTTPTAPTAPTTAGTSNIVVNASGTASGGVNAHFKLLVDGVKVGEGTTATTAKDYAFTAKITDDVAHKVQVQYDNDTHGRDLYVNKITINGKAVLPTASNVTYDKGALDGKDVVAGQSAMWWNGTLVVNADKSYFPVAKAAAAASAAAAADAPLESWLHQTASTDAAPAAHAAEPAAFDLGIAAHDIYAVPDTHVGVAHDFH